MKQRDNLIAFTSIVKSFGGGASAVPIVDNVTLDIRRGEFVTLLGPSGCGKSTLLNMSAGLMRPTSGSVRYDGVEVEDVNCRVGYMTQADHLLPWRTIAANIEVPLEIKGVAKSARRNRVCELLALVGLTGFGDHYPTQVSGGMRKRAALARVLAADPETLLMDEPFSALDALLRVAMQQELLRLCHRLGKTVLFVTHDIDEAVALADRCVVLGPRPTSIRRVLDIDLEKPRDLIELRGTPRYQALCAELWRLMATYIPEPSLPLPDVLPVLEGCAS